MDHFPRPYPQHPSTHITESSFLLPGILMFTPSNIFIFSPIWLLALATYSLAVLVSCHAEHCRIRQKGRTSAHFHWWCMWKVHIISTFFSESAWQGIFSIYSLEFMFWANKTRHLPHKSSNRSSHQIIYGLIPIVIKFTKRFAINKDYKSNRCAVFGTE